MATPIKFRHVALLAVATCGPCCAVYFLVFDQSPKINKARSLIGQPVERIEQELGPPRHRLSDKDFNSKMRATIERGYVPHDVPSASGEVWIYEFLNQIVVLYERNGKVERIYTGGT